jgi:hypothetical protein
LLDLLLDTPKSQWTGKMNEVLKEKNALDAHMRDFEGKCLGIEIFCGIGLG